MISSVTDQDDVDDEVSHDRDSPVHHDQALRLRQGYDFSQVRKETQNTYQFGHRPTNQITIDASLSRLFECMSLAYRGGKVVSPKWKNFKGMRLSVKDKIRLNNAIWRTWHIQYIMRRRRSKISFVQFATPLDNESDCDSHSKPEAVVMEGKYWKRRIETVVAEYKKWRAFFMEKLRQSDHPGLTWVSHDSPTASDMGLPDVGRGNESLMNEFTDRLLSCLSQPTFQFPNPREIAQHATNSDMMQPGLLQLQPMIEDLMDPFEEIFNPNKKTQNSNSVNLFYAGPNFQSSPQPADFNNGFLMQHDSNSTGLQEASLEELVQRTTVEQDHTTMCETAVDNTMQQIPAPRQHDIPDLMEQSNNMSIGVSDPMLNPVVGSLYPQSHQNSGNYSQADLMMSKQQRLTPNLNQPNLHMKMQIPQHNQNKNAMPPPQKKAPRRRSSHGIFLNELNSPKVTLKSNPPQQYMSSSKNFVNQKDQVLIQMPPNHPQICTNPASTTVLQPIVISSNMGNLAISSHASCTPMDKLIYTKPLTAINVQTVDHGMVIDSINDNSKSIGTHLMSQKVNAGLSQIIQATPTQQSQSIQGKFDEAAPNIEIVRTQSQTAKQTMQHTSQSSLTQLLQIGNKSTTQRKSHLEISSSQPVIAVKQSQLRKVQEQAQNFNNFQNSVVLAAAQLATAPQTSMVAMQQPLEGSVENVSNISHNVVSLSVPQLYGITKNPVEIQPDVPIPPPAQFPNAHKIQPQMVENSEKLSSWSVVSDSFMEMDEGSESKLGQCSFDSAQSDLLTGQATSPSAGLPASSDAEQRTTEQIRRCNMKSFFKRLQDLIPETSSHPNTKASKAVILSKSCKYMRELQSQRQTSNLKIQKLKKEIKELNEKISNFQQQLPATGAPVSRKHGNQMGQYFDEWVRERTLHNWKFFIFSMIVRPWFVTYDRAVSITSLEELCKTCLMWLEKQCSLPSLRKDVVNSLQELSTTTSILSDPSHLQQQAETAVQKSTSRRSSYSSS